MSQGKIVLMACGSFSPPTYMHLRLFEIAKDSIHALGLGTVVGGIMSPVHDAYGKQDLAPANHRIAMLKLALRSSTWVKMSEWETHQAGWTRTRISLQYHQDTINDHIHHSDNNPPPWLPDDVLNVNNVNSIDETDNLMERLQGSDGTRRSGEVKVKLLCGGDLLESFAKPGLWAEEDIETIVGQHGIVVVSRAGSDPGRFIYESDILSKYRKNIVLVTNYVLNEISSSTVRRLLRRRESAKYLMEDSVLAYIRQHRLFGTGITEYEYALLNELIVDKRSPQDVAMLSPEEKSFKNILISIRDKPSIIDETVTIKKPRKSNFLLPTSHTDSVSPVKIKPKVAYAEPSTFKTGNYLDKAPSTFLPGKAVKIVSDGREHVIKNEKVSFDECNSLESYLKKDEYDLYKRRVSEGNVEHNLNIDNTVKKRCSSTIRKLKPDDMKKSKSEVSKLCDKMKSIKLKEKDGRSYKTRSCNDIVRLILTKHGIHVISDTEAIV